MSRGLAAPHREEYLACQHASDSLEARFASTPEFTPAHSSNSENSVQVEHKGVSEPMLDAYHALEVTRNESCPQTKTAGDNKNLKNEPWVPVERKRKRGKNNSFTYRSLTEYQTEHKRPRMWTPYSGICHEPLFPEFLGHIPDTKLSNTDSYVRKKASKKNLQKLEAAWS